MMPEDTENALAAAMESLQLSEYSEVPQSWARERHYYNEGARHAARVFKRHMEAMRRNEEEARLKRLKRMVGAA